MNNGKYMAVKKSQAEKGLESLRSFLIVGFVVLIGDTGRGVMFPTLWPLVSSLGGDHTTQGFTVAAYSFGRVISSPYFGSWSTTYGYQKVLVLSCSIIAIGCVIYAKATSCNMLIVAQTIIGIGSGTLGVTRAYVADQSTRKTRTVLMAQLTALQYTGFTVTPVVGALLCRALGNNNYQLPLGLPVLNEFTAPAYVMALLSLLAIVLLLVLFKDYIPRDRLKSAVHSVASEADIQVHKPFSSDEKTTWCTLNYQYSSTPPAVTPEPSRASSVRQSGTEILELEEEEEEIVSDFAWKSMIAWGFLMNVVTKGSVSCYETLGIIVFMDDFGFRKADAGFIFSLCGTIGVLALLSMKWLCKWTSDVHLVFNGCMLMALSGVLIYFGYFVGSYGIIASIFLMYSLGYPVGHTAVIGMFSKIVGAKTNKQGTLLGWFGSAGSLARIFFPIFCGFISTHYGSTEVFLYTSSLIVVAMIALLIFWKPLLNIVAA